MEGGSDNKMKEIGGLGDRLSGLEQLLLDAKKKVTEQQDLAQAFLQNQARASGLRDTSILPDLCASHRQQLLGEELSPFLSETVKHKILSVSNDEEPPAHSLDTQAMRQGQGGAQC